MYLVTRGSFGWSKTTPARSFATFGPNFLKIVDAGRKRHATSLPDLRGEGCFCFLFFRAPLLLHKGPDGPGKPAGLRNGYLLRRGAFATPALKPAPKMDSTVRPPQGAGGNIMAPNVGLSSDKASESPNPRPRPTSRMVAGSRPVRQQEPDVKKKSWVSRCSS
jgi:hypothetical protein